MHLDARLALVAIAVAIVGLPVSGAVIWWLYGVAMVFLAGAVFGDIAWKRWRSWRLRGIRFMHQRVAEDDEAVRRVRIYLTRPIKHGLLITCSPDTWIERPPAARVDHGIVSDGRSKLTAGQGLTAQGRDNRVLVRFSLDQKDIKTETMISVDLDLDARPVSVEPAKEKSARQLLAGAQ